MAKREMKTQNVEETKVEQAEPVEVIKEEKKSSISKGVVVDCEKLNVRKAAKKDSDVVVIIDKDSKITIDEDKSTDEWYRIKTEKNVWGFCMKQYVKLV